MSSKKFSKARSLLPFKVDLTKKKAEKNLMTNEDDEKTTKTGWEIYKQYIPYGGGLTSILILNTILIGQKIVPIFVDLHFGQWILTENQ